MDRRGFDLERPYRSSSKIVFCWTGKAEETERYTTQSHKENIYNALVLPHLDYCCVLWQGCGRALQQRVERIQNYGMRLICSKPPGTSSDELRKGLNWLPLGKCREMFRLALVHRCIHNQASTYLEKCFKTNEMYGQHLALYNLYMLYLSYAGVCAYRTPWRTSHRLKGHSCQKLKFIYL